MVHRKIKNLVLNMINKLPKELQHIIFKANTEIRFLKFKIVATMSADRNVPNPSKIYWISPKRIIFHTNYLGRKSAKRTPFVDRVFPRNMRGKVIDGKWDITDYEFSNLLVYNAFKKRIEDGAEWQNTQFYKSILRAAESGRYFWGIQNQSDLDERCKFLDSLYKSIKDNGFRLNRSICDSDSTYDEIDVNIGRNGEYLFQNGVHRLSIAKILGINCIPTMVFVRHKEWQDFREYVISYAKQQRRGRLYQPVVHPDLADVPYYDQEGHNCEDIMKAIKVHIEQKKGIMLDIGANIGFFCHKFEDLGYRCYAVEKDPFVFRILKKLKIAENKKFKLFNESIFDVEVIKNTKFDVVLALNIFHHFLKTEADFVKFKHLLKNLKTDSMFFEAHKYNDTQMNNAFINFTQPEFVDFILQHTSLNKSEVIYTAKNGRTIFKLIK